MPRPFRFGVNLQAEHDRAGLPFGSRGSAWTICSARPRSWTGCPAPTDSPTRAELNLLIQKVLTVLEPYMEAFAPVVAELGGH
ncbi:hypothetical protein [Streptomyces sp. NPDC001604]|uniref:hypothetical protein n=1 Tax=Streptomyces sp. NPDC001604 TaxID=3364593 RepID=UPI003686D359